MSKKHASDKAQDRGALVLKGEKRLSVIDLMSLRPSDVIRFSVYDHEETKLYGVLRDEMQERRQGEPADVWQARCDEADNWNHRRSRVMTAVFVAKVEERYGSDNEAVQMLRIAHGLVAGLDGPGQLAAPVGTNLLTAGDEERDSQCA